MTLKPSVYIIGYVKEARDMKFNSKRLPALGLKLVLPSFGVLALVVFSSIIMLEATKATVVFAEDGKEQTVKTHANTVGDLLEELGVDVGEHDFVSVREDEKLRNGLTIDYSEAKRVYLTVDDETHEHYTTLDTVEELFSEENLTITERDDISHNIDQKVFDDLHVVINKAFEVVIDDGGEEIKAWSTGDTVKNILNKHNIELEESDKVEPALDEKVMSDEQVSITRIDTETKSVEESVAFETETKNDNSLKKGKQKTVTQGKEGKLVKKFEVTYENGEEKDRKLVSEKMKNDPVNQVVAIGTKEEQKKNPKKKEPNLVTVSKSSSSDEPSGEVHHMVSTAYTVNCDGCDGRGITATGINLNNTPKVVAVDPNVIPLGSKVWVEGYGYAIAGDTGGAIKGNRIDLHVQSKSEAMGHGYQKRKVIVVK